MVILVHHSPSQMATMLRELLFGLVLLDKAVFEQKRVRLGVDHNEGKSGNFAHELAGFARVARLVGKIAGHAVFQAFGLPNVNNFAFGIEILVNARLLGQVAHLFF